MWIHSRIDAKADRPFTGAVRGLIEWNLLHPILVHAVEKPTLIGLNTRLGVGGELLTTSAQTVVESTIRIRIR